MSAIKHTMYQTFSYLDTLQLSLDEVSNQELLEQLILAYEEEANIGFGEDDIKSLVKGYYEHYKGQL